MRIFTLCYGFFAVIILASYTANLAAYLTVSINVGSTALHSGAGAGQSLLASVWVHPFVWPACRGGRS